ncbi:membrane-associated guanylate kinase, WW and PDZ domain-containing protein 2-like [Amia ocellicauda]|uniref:membrane-associated guanylate kinase, WW and PDZ domain-containing protein 2-like n=1 Tax=Amia ocellicauda TaxID=2972642 RepID=UPI0034648F41
MTMPLSSSHPALPSDPIHLLPLEPAWDTKGERKTPHRRDASAGGKESGRAVDRAERSLSPQRTDPLRPGQALGKRPAERGGGGRTAGEGGRSTAGGSGAQGKGAPGAAAAAEQDAVSGATPRKQGQPKAPKAARGRSKERMGERAGTLERREPDQSLRGPGADMNGGAQSNGNNPGSPPEPAAEKPDREPAKVTQGTSSAARKSTVSPGPWKIPGSDKLPSALKSGTSTVSR